MRKLSMDELNRISVEDFKKEDKTPLCFILDDIRSMNNVGSVFRTSDAFLIEKIYLCGITGKPPHRDIEKTALGATESVDWLYHESGPDLVKQLKEEGWIILALEQAESSVFLSDFKPEKNLKYACVLGNEVFGVNDEIISQADYVIEIPQFGTKHSLNVAVSAGILAWDFYSKIKL